MALDLGELVARVTVETTAADRGLSAFERNLLRVARTQVPDIALDVATSVAQGALAELEALLRGLPDGEADANVDTEAAQRRIEQLRAELRGIPDADIDVDVNPPDLSDLSDGAGSAGRQAGDAAGEGLSAGVIAAIATIPVAGAIVGIGAAIGKSLLDGLQNEVREDTLVATTGLDPAAAQRIGRAAGEAYAANFGDSIEGNFDTARAALQNGLLDPESTARDSQAIIQSLDGVASILGEDIPRVSRAAATLLRSGLVDSADEAFDIFVKGQQNGANAAEDLLDTFTEYPAVLEKLGLSGQDALGLITQGLQAGARDSDFVADALKELQIRATDGSKASADAFEILGINAEEATAKIAGGGAGAREGLDSILDGLRAIEDPVKRNEAAVGLFGTKAEDLGDALFALDLDKVATDLGTVEGAASGAISALGTNAAGSLESARRNIEVATDGIKGALAEAFGPQINDFAATVSGNRTAVVTFLLEVGNAGLDAGRALIEGAASATEAFGDFVGETGPPVLGLVSSIVEGLNKIGLVSDDARNEFREVAAQAEEDFARFDDSSGEAADAIRENLITNGLDPVQERLNEVGFDLTTQARFTDATSALAGAVADIGFKADGTKLAIDGAAGSFDVASESGRILDAQIRAAASALDAQVVAGQQAGRTTEELTADYDANREALITQIEQMGFSRQAAEDLATEYGALPDLVVTTIRADGVTTVLTQIDDLTTKLTRIDGDVVTFTVRQVNTETGRVSVSSVQARASGGSVVQGEPYLVGEEGPELVVAESDGFVIPAGPTAQILAGGFGSPTPLAAGSSGAAQGPLGAGVVIESLVINEAANARQTGAEVIKAQRLSVAEKRGAL